jgi:Fe-S-cluster containining protein
MLPQWIDKGLPFHCTGCGKCCTGAPGYIWINEEEEQAIASHLGLDLNEFRQKYTEKVRERTTLIELPEQDNDCVFLKGKSCSIYDVRPTQCRTYPFWPDNLSSRAAWKETAAECEGIQQEATLVPRKEIEERLNQQIRDGAQEWAPTDCSSQLDKRDRASPSKME